MSSTQNLPITAALMMGGKSRRMGTDKAWLVVGGVPLWQRQAQVLRETGAAEVVISVASEHSVQVNGVPAIVDEVEGQGPLRALSTLLKRSTHAGVLVLGVDLPRMHSKFLHEITALGVASSVAVIPEADGRLQPLAAYYPKACLPLIDEQLAVGEFAIHRFIQRAAGKSLAVVRPVASEQWPLFTNLNTPEDVAAYRRADGC